MKNQTSWAMADLLVFADKENWLPRAQSYVVSKGYGVATVRNYLRVGNRFPPKTRIYKLTFTHYMFAVPKGDDAEKWLERAQQGDAGVPWSVDQFYTCLSNERQKEKMVDGRPMLRRQAKQTRVRYNRPHTEDPFATFEVVAQQTAVFIREQTRLPIEERRRMYDRVSRVIVTLNRAFYTLESSLPSGEIEIKANA